MVSVDPQQLHRIARLVDAFAAQGAVDLESVGDDGSVLVSFIAGMYPYRWKVPVAPDKPLGEVQR
jgi:hypothetical protein